MESHGSKFDDLINQKPAQYDEMKYAQLMEQMQL